MPKILSRKLVTNIFSLESGLPAISHSANNEVKYAAAPSTVLIKSVTGMLYIVLIIVRLTTTYIKIALSIGRERSKHDFFKFIIFAIDSIAIEIIDVSAPVQIISHATPIVP